MIDPTPFSPLWKSIENFQLSLVKTSTARIAEASDLSLAAGSYLSVEVILSVVFGTDLSLES